MKEIKPEHRGFHSDAYPNDQKRIIPQVKMESGQGLSEATRRHLVYRLTRRIDAAVRNNHDSYELYLKDFSLDLKKALDNDEQYVEPNSLEELQDRIAEYMDSPGFKEALAAGEQKAIYDEEVLTLRYEQIDRFFRLLKPIMDALREELETFPIDDILEEEDKKYRALREAIDNNHSYTANDSEKLRLKQKAYDAFEEWRRLDNTLRIVNLQRKTR